MNYQKQLERFEKIFTKNKELFGSQIWETEPNFLFFVEIPLDDSLHSSSGQILKNIQKSSDLQNGFFVSPWNLHITLALPGRLGVHFQGNEIFFMQEVLEKITNSLHKFEIELANLNCFANVIFREVLDKSGDLYSLHEMINSQIPFAQHPDYQMSNFIPHVSLFYNEIIGENIFQSNFDRTLDHDTMLVEKIIFGKAKNDDGQFSKEVLTEFTLK